MIGRRAQLSGMPTGASARTCRSHDDYDKDRRIGFAGKANTADSPSKANGTRLSGLTIKQEITA